MEQHQHQEGVQGALVAGLPGLDSRQASEVVHRGWKTVVALEVAAPDQKRHQSALVSPVQGCSMADADAENAADGMELEGPDCMPAVHNLALYLRWLASHVDHVHVKQWYGQSC